MTETNEQVTTRCGHPGCGKPIVWSIDGWMHESALDQWLSDEAHAAIPEEDSMAHPDEETTVLTPVGNDEVDPHEWLARPDNDDDLDVDNDFDDNDDDFDDVPLPPPPAPQGDDDGPMLSVEHRENVAIFQEAARALRMMKLDTGVSYSITDVLKVADWLKGKN
jgi:hypothetical protein